jgi:hypothetical protein
MTSGRVLLDQRSYRTGYIRLPDSIHPRTNSLQIVVGHVRESSQSYPVTAIVGAQQCRIGVDKLNGIDAPGVYQAQRQPNPKSNGKAQVTEVELVHGSPSK